MKLFKFGLVATIIYFLLLAIAIIGFGLEMVSSWNELGDFLAGVFSPVAFLWLVLGYIQQQKELQQNTDALRLQATELKNSVQQYADMVAVAKEQLQTDKQMIEKNWHDKKNQYKPRIKAPQIISAYTIGGDRSGYRGILELAGEDAMNLTISTEPKFAPYHGYNAHTLKGGLHVLGDSGPIMISDLPNEIILTIKYESKHGDVYTDIYTYIRGETPNYAIIDDEHI